MTPQQLDTLVENLRRFEGAVPWLYLDSAAIPNVTVGIGVMLPSAGDALALPFENVGLGRSATEDEVSQAFARVRGMRGGMGPSFYRGFPELELPPEEVTALAMRRLEAVFLPGLQQQFHEFGALPFPAQEVLVDLGWNLGLTGLSKFHNLAAAVDRRDWARAAEESHVATSRPARNEWRAETFRSC
jgi:GH24 family phage-related lysozyme (muramidase)